MSDIERKGISTSEEATLRCHIAELERNLLFANDALAKCDLARQNAGGMEMQIQELERKNAELQQEHDFLMKWFEKHGTKAHHSVFEVFDNVEIERDQLRLQVVRLREALQRIWDADEMGYLIGDGTHQCVQCSGKKRNEDTNSVQHDPECVQGWIELALSETPAQSAKEVLEPTLDLLKEFVWLEDKDSLRIKLKAELQRLERLYK